MLGWAILLLTAVMSVTWSLHRLLWQDEIFSLQTDRVATLGEVLRIQRVIPDLAGAAAISCAIACGDGCLRAVRRLRCGCLRLPATC